MNRLWPLIAMAALAAQPGLTAPRVLVPQLETQGRVCHGHFHATDRQVSFRSQTLNCLNRRYTRYREEAISRPDIPLFGTRSQVFHLPRATAQCRVTVIEVVEPAETDTGYWYLFFYANEEAFITNRFYQNKAQNDVLPCMGYEVVWPRKARLGGHGTPRVGPATPGLAPLPQAASR
ncbi:hypothetical protein PSQ20_12430 [Curvibacter sp. RS43]|uniref:hypothetical protein n=1 Tax=Curvibacter microcysteis TaxID=3026419 RepID=UPI0023601468|nr:hypothetical protein [Curvibacter sp. RS43]MDD0811153.1 hypothetical protein [Curvibacter sp. RS43]